MEKIRFNTEDKEKNKENKPVSSRTFHSCNNRYNKKIIYYFRKLRGEYIGKDDTILEKIKREYDNKCIVCKIKK